MSTYTTNFAVYEMPFYQTPFDFSWWKNTYQATIVQMESSKFISRNDLSPVTKLHQITSN